MKPQGMPQELPELTAYREQVGGPDAQAVERMEHRVNAFAERLEREAHVGVGGRGWTRVSRATWLAAAAVAIALGSSWWMLGRGGGQPTTAATVAESTTAASVAMRSDLAPQVVELPLGGRLTLAPKTNIQLSAADAWGATINLYDGAVTVEVNQAPGRVWQVVSGDYSVEAVGTIFHVRRTTSVPEVRVDRGRVIVRGPGLPEEGVFVTAGHALPDAISAAVSNDDEREPVDRDPSESADTPRVPKPPASGTVQATRPNVPEHATPDISKGVARGGKGADSTGTAPRPWIDSFRRAVKEGDTAKALHTLPGDFPDGSYKLSAQDYLDAGDILRSGADRSRVERTYLKACDVGPKSRACSVAVIRRAINAAALGHQNQAITLATQYLNEWPDGALAREALGRRMKWQWKAGQRAEAVADAKDYLRRFPSGSLAQFARDITAEP